MSGYGDSHGSMTSQAMAGFFQRSKDVFSDMKCRPTLVSRARVLHITSPISRAIHTCLLRGVIGSGLRYEPSDVSDYFDNYDTIASTLKHDFKRLSHTKLFDAMGHLTFTQLESLVFETMILSGEAWLFRVGDGNKWRVREPDYVMSPDNNTNPLIIDGIELDDYGVPVAVWYCSEPYAVVGQRSFERIPIYDEDGVRLVIHVYKQERPEQLRGLPLTAPVIQNLWSTMAFCESELQMAILQCNQSLIVTTQTNNSLNPYGTISPRDLDAPLIAPTPNTPTDEKKKPAEFSILPPLGNSGFDGLINKMNFVSPGQSHHLREGEDVKFLSPTAPSSSLSQFVDLQMRMLGAALGIPEQVLSGKFDANFSAVKGATSAFNHTVKQFRTAFIESFLKPLFEVFAYSEIARYNWICDDSLTASQLMALESLWLPNDSPLTLDPSKEIQFYITAVDAGLITRDEAAQALFGHDAVGVIQ